ncbi:MAG: hypothetical protein UX10_C0006G0011 [Candidatus Magasanikbacteria bacterium GW2011_GWA2_45_39]|uniref:Aminoglycoside phosphotransferase domain-containing protein n=1 Tax=Candidatus Magasanikbacteria bacterium GW2011_GWA2_45_39 TaxID=1619041 RepID=A0A0G1QGI4_9BACT|nr:MAG: hypothetical protein UX10_C0006G0011 [Candidatus Magasanikbacteria bacterium GW2011_GWA2_45_39]
MDSRNQEENQGKGALFGPNNHSFYSIEWQVLGPELTASNSRLILDHYSFNKVVRIQQVREWEKMSNNFWVVVESEGKESEILFRKHLQLKDQNSLAILSKIIHFLEEKKVPVPHIIETKAQQLFFKEAGHFYQSFEFIGGNHFRGTSRELQAAAQSIGRLHLALSVAPFEKEIIERPVILPPWTQDGWKELQIAADQKSGQFNAVVKEGLWHLVKQSENLAKNLVTARQQLIHCDLHPQNFIFKNDKLQAILDFEGVRMGELIRDVGNACHRLVRQFVVLQGGDWRTHLAEGLKIFLQAYSEVNPLNNQEILAIPYFIKDELLRKLFHNLNVYYREGDDKYLIGGELEKKLNLLREAIEIENFLPSL